MGRRKTRSTAQANKPARAAPQDDPRTSDSTGGGMDLDEGVGASAPGTNAAKVDDGSGVSASKAADSKEKSSLSPEELAKRKVDREVKAANLTVDIATKKR